MTTFSIKDQNQNQHKISALFVRKDSIYKELDIDSWDIDRDALKWPGGNAIICHPPCRSWGRLRKFSKPDPGERELSFFAIDMIRKFGGALEHPHGSKLFPEFLPLPGETDIFGGFTVSLNQRWFGHKAMKNTLVYIFGTQIKNLPPMPLNFDAIQYTVSPYSKSRKNGKKQIGKKFRDYTPENFAKWLIEVVEICNQINFK